MVKTTKVFAVFSVLLCWIFGAALAAGTTYKVVGELGEDQLVAQVGGKSYVLLDLGKLTPKEYARRLDGLASIHLDAVADFDGDGTQDALIDLFGGGNCCPPEYAFVSFKPGQKVVLTEGFSHWDNPVVETVGGRKTVRMRDEDDAKTYWYGLKGGKLVTVKTQPIASLPAWVELTLKNVSAVDGGTTTMEVDLNEDGNTETISCGYWDRWHTLMCEVSNSKNQKLLSGLGCDRLGVLEQKTKGYHDLVCGLDTRLKWDGKQYPQGP